MDETKRNYTTWEEELTSDDAVFRDENEEAIGLVRPVGASWEVLYRGTTIAIRPTKQLAMKAVTDMHSECA